MTVIGLEHLRGELTQPLIDRYLAGGNVSELATMLKSSTWSPPCSSGPGAGMRIVALTMAVPPDPSSVGPSTA
ncbi:hypothetical protein H2136_06260 [Aeromonas hydrophila]|uniref:Uncharacterized protein n=1 Tax=Aeromonas hydrophila TaxID=644 RepID=A0A926FNG4_AERHY|nr:hypothetical protein [Aeromonas hydrophila]